MIRSGTVIKKLLTIAVTLLCAAGASGHLLPAQNATMNIVGNSAFFVVSVPVSALSDVDDDHNGALSNFEITRHSQDIANQFAARFRVSDENNPVQRLPGWVSTPQTEGAPVDQRYVVILMRAMFVRPPMYPTITTDLFGSGTGEGQMTLTATRGTMAEVAILTADAPLHSYFHGGLATFFDFVRVGVQHILTGPDHLLFLLTVIVAAAGWRYWLGVVTSFTIAHSITLTMAALGVVHVSPTIVEPGIAVSIVLMAALNLFGGQVVAGQRQWQRIAIVFGCGLLHGLGFASAIGAMAIDVTHRLATLVGFNIGIELGQFIFLDGLLGTTLIVQRLYEIRDLRWAPRFASIAAALLGAAMLLERVLPSLPSVS